MLPNQSKYRGLIINEETGEEKDSNNRQNFDSINAARLFAADKLSGLELLDLYDETGETVITLDPWGEAFYR